MKAMTVSLTPTPLARMRARGASWVGGAHINTNR